MFPASPYLCLFQRQVWVVWVDEKNSWAESSLVVLNLPQYYNVVKLVNLKISTHNAARLSTSAGNFGRESSTYNPSVEPRAALSLLVFWPDSANSQTHRFFPDLQNRCAHLPHPQSSSYFLKCWTTL